MLNHNYSLCQKLKQARMTNNRLIKVLSIIFYHFTSISLMVWEDCLTLAKVQGIYPYNLVPSLCDNCIRFPVIALISLLLLSRVFGNDAWFYNEK